MNVFCEDLEEALDYALIHDMVEQMRPILRVFLAEDRRGGLTKAKFDIIYILYEKNYR